MEIKAPANVKGTRFLMIAKDGVTDQRIYLPSLGKVRRITGESEGTESFSVPIFHIMTCRICSGTAV
nr:outer membrane lipoprotein-sorting protein [Treponema sp. OMZ 803]